MNKSESKPLYRRLLGQGYTLLPSAIQQMHDAGDEVVFLGVCSVSHGKSLMARLLTKLLPLPKPGENLPLRLHIKSTQDSRQNKEHWTRHFGKFRFYSQQWEANERLYEKIQNIVSVFEPSISDQGLEFRLKHLSAFGVAFPASLMPNVTIRETEKNGMLHFFAQVSLKKTGMLTTYEGWIEKQIVTHAK